MAAFLRIRRCPVRERLRELEIDVRDLEMLPAAEVRERGRRRGRRQLAVGTAAGAVVAVTAGVALAWPAAERPVMPAERPVSPTAAESAPGVSCVLRLPNSPEAVGVRVLDGGADAGLADDVVTQLRVRRFGVMEGPVVEGAAADVTTLTYGPMSVGAAQLLRSLVLGEVAMRFDPERRDRLVDLTVGPGFERLATAAEFNQNLAVAGEPSAPPECR